MTVGKTDDGAKKEAYVTAENVSSFSDAGSTQAGSIHGNSYVKRQPLLLHSCCGPCSTACIERLLSDWDITVFYYNPNITDKEEYELRKSEQIRFIREYSRKNLLGERINFVEGKYDPAEYYSAVSGHEGDREGGKRCELCFRLRLTAAAAEAKKLGIDTFGTTLTVSPYKNYDIITMIGTELAVANGLSWLDRDFKKKAGYQRSIEMSKEYGLYRQHFCGCEFSKQD
ncbi:MAG: epoxyqueuosine reductase QueH [Firmicutes bacterium]|nr:epoxyqueuosine reductase QueH [Bacillota bacterium]